MPWPKLLLEPTHKLKPRLRLRRKLSVGLIKHRLSLGPGLGLSSGLSLGLGLDLNLIKPRDRVCYSTPVFMEAGKCKQIRNRPG